MIALSVAKPKMFLPESEMFLCIKPKKKQKTFLWKVWVNADDKKYAKTQEMFLVVKLRLSDHKVLHNMVSSSGFFFNFAWIFSLFSHGFRTSIFSSLRNLIKQLFHSRLLDMSLVIANSAVRQRYIQRALME